MAWGFLTSCFGRQFQQLWSTKAKYTRIVLYVWKALLIVPAAMAAWSDRVGWQQVEHNLELQNWPYNVHGDMREAWWWGYIAFVLIAPWALISVLLVWRLRGRWLLLWGLLDLGLAVFACYGVSLQNLFLPNYGLACSVDKAVNWQVVDGHPSLFKMISLLEGETKDPKRVCKELVSYYELGVACICIQLLIAYISIFSDENPYSLLNAWRPAYIIAKPLLIWPGIGLVRLHYAFAPPARLYISRAKKSLYRLRKPANFAILELTQYKSADRRFCMPGSKLMDVLFIEHLLLNVVDNMHYQDVVNLSMTCHAAREAVYPRNDLAMRVPKLEGICCEKDTKRTCLYCNKIMCSCCTQIMHLPAQPGRRHTTKCKAYCRNCYYTAFSLHPRGWKRPCKGHGDKFPDEHQDVCRSCANNYSEGMRVQRKRRFQQLARDIAFGRIPVRRDSEGAIGTGIQDGDGSADAQCVQESVQRDKPVDGRRCGKCTAELTAGMRWWVCGICGGECRDSIHPVHVRKREMWDLDVEKTGGADDRPVAELQVPWWKRWRRT